MKREFLRNDFQRVKILFFYSSYGFLQPISNIIIFSLYHRKKADTRICFTYIFQVCVAARVALSGVLVFSLYMYIKFSTPFLFIPFPRKFCSTWKFILLIVYISKMNWSFFSNKYLSLDQRSRRNAFTPPCLIFETSAILELKITG